MKRLFFALWPDSLTRQRCTEVLKLLPDAECKPVDPNNLHVTLVFLGNVDTATELALGQAVASISVREMSITFNAFNFWKKPAILCLTAQQFDVELAKLVKQLNTIAQQLAIDVDDRPYVPHVTLARKAREIERVNVEPITWRSKSFCLVESCSLPTGIEYRVSQTWGERSLE